MIPKLNPQKETADFSAAMKLPDEDDKPLVQELLYDGETTFLVGDPAAGKSTLATQIAMSLTVGEPVFGLFEVARSVNVYYIALETRWHRQVRTIRKMSRKIGVDFNRLCWSAPVGLDFTSDKTNDIQDLLAQIGAWKKPLGVVIIDPLYLTVGQDLKDGTAARAVSCFLNRLMNETGAAALVLHHSHREKYTASGKRQEEDDNIYGSRWLQAHMAVGWNVKSTATGTKWRLTKDRFKASRKEFELTFDDVTQTSVVGAATIKSAHCRLQTVLAAEPEGSLLTYAQLAQRTGNTVNYVKTLMFSDSLFRQFADYVDGGPGKPAAWRVRPHGEQPKPQPDFAAMDAV